MFCMDKGLCRYIGLNKYYNWPLWKNTNLNHNTNAQNRIPWDNTVISIDIYIVLYSMSNCVLPNWAFSIHSGYHFNMRVFTLTEIWMPCVIFICFKLMPKMKIVTITVFFLTIFCPITVHIPVGPLIILGI